MTPTTIPAHDTHKAAEHLARLDRKADVLDGDFLLVFTGEERPDGPPKPLAADHRAERFPQ